MEMLQLLGAPVLRGPDGVLHFRRQQRFRLLAYLAVQRQPVDRDRLAFMFWPDLEGLAARRNLRKTWFHLRRLPGLRGLNAQGSETGALGWQVASDLERFEQAWACGDLRAAVDACGGPLLLGLDGGSAEFQRWLQMERDRLGQQFRDAVLRLVATLDTAEHARGLDWLSRLLAEDPLDEAAARAQVRLLALAGRRASARRAHLRWRQLLRKELGVDAPDDIETLLATPPAVRAVARQPTCAGPVYVSSFVGRRSELAHLHKLLSDGMRLISLLGPPGCGKTRLAAQALHELELPAITRRAFVELDRLPAGGTPGEFALQIAAALGLQLSAGPHAVERLREFIDREPTWLVLDNFEHRLGDLPSLLQLLRAPRLQVLVTSRSRLAVDGETCVELEGLGVDPAAASDDATALFVARSGQPTTAATSEAVRQLCALLQGQPLAIELAARHSRLLGASLLAQRVAADIDTLAGGGAELPPRQRSLRAAFETSWQLLPSALQQALARLAVLRADFGRSAARGVAGTGDAALAALIDHSLLRMEPATGRLRWHPFVREFALDKLAADRGARAEMEIRHASHFARWLQDLDLREESPAPAALREAATEIEHLVDAWQHALAHRRHALWDTLAEALALHHEIHARYRRGSELLAGCPLAPPGAPAGVQRAAAQVVVLRARLLHWAENDQADQLAGQALAVFESLGDHAGRIAAWRVQAVIAWRRGQVDAAIALYRRALALCDSSGQQGKRAMLLDGLGLALIHQGDAEGSRAAFEQALELNDRSGNGLQRVHNLINLALDARTRSPPRARALASRALALAREIGFEHYVPHGLATLSLAHTAAGETVQARSLAAEAVELTHRSGDTYIESWSLTALARACLAEGRLHDAAAALTGGIELSWRERDLGLVAQHLALTAQWLLARGQTRAAQEIVAALLGLSSVPHWQRLALLELQRRTGPAGGEPLALATVVQLALGELLSHPP